MGQVKLTAENIAKHFVYETQYGVLICRLHRSAMRNVDTHLRESHGVPAAERRRIAQHYAWLWIETDPSKVALPPAMSAPFEALGRPLDGWQCEHVGCGRMTVNKTKMQQHMNKKHGERCDSKGGGKFKAVKLQTFFSSGGRQRYFTVSEAAAKEAIPKAAATTAATAEVDALMAEWKQVQERHEQEMKVIEEEMAKRDSTGWFKRTEWPERMKGMNMEHLAYAIRLPGRTEPKLVRLKAAVERMVEQSVAGLDTLGREIRRWLRSAKREEPDTRPLARLQNPESQLRYAGYVVKFLCCVMRLVADNDDETLADARKLVRMDDEQKARAQELWTVLDADDEQRAVRATLRLMKRFIFVQYAGSPFETAMVGFMAVLGVDVDTLRLRTAKGYSYTLAGMVYCMRVLGAELLLPAARRSEQGAADRDRCMEWRRGFLADGSFTPMSEMLSLLAYGKRVALDAGNEGASHWSKDKSIYYLHGQPIVVERFRRMAQDVVTELEEKVWELMWVTDRRERFDVQPAAIADDVALARRGMSFVGRSENGMCDGLRWTLHRVTGTAGGRQLRTRDGEWNRRQVASYLRRVDRFLELLLFAVHVTAGQPARGTEATSMRHRNGVVQDRNVYVADGDVMMVTRYCKTQSQWDRPRVVPRFLPDRLGRVMVLHLGWLQKLQEYLRVLVLDGAFSDYVWSNEHGPWDTDKLTRIISRETGKRLGVTLTTQGYRHAAIGIGREKVGPEFTLGYREDELDNVEEPEMDDEGVDKRESALELQTGHTTQVGEDNYSVPLDVVKHLSARSVQVFRALSVKWHGFLGLGRAKAQAAEAKAAATAETRAAKRARCKRPAVDEVELAEAMRRALRRRDVGFKSAGQEQALRAIVGGETPLVVVLPTGGGKTLLFMAPACMADAGTTVVVVAFRELITRTIETVRAAGIDCIEWQYGERRPATVVVVSADRVGGADGKFMAYAAVLAEQGLLRRVVVDEAHLIVTASSWRPKLGRLDRLRSLNVPTVLLSATIPPSMMGELAVAMSIRNARYIRASTVRANIRYVVSWCENGATEAAAVALCRRQQERLVDGLKGIVYCNSTEGCERLAAELGCAWYHAKMVDRRAGGLDEWVSGGGLIVATSALGTGVDFPGVVLVMHVGMPWSMIDFAQESGRGGRQGELVDSVIVVDSAGVRRRLKEGVGDADVEAMGRFVEGTGCRRLAMSEYLDGVDLAMSCGDTDTAGCDRCGEGRAELLEKRCSWAAQRQRTEQVMDELARGCPTCWVMQGSGESHGLKKCTRRAWCSQERLDRLRARIRYGKDVDACHRCGVAQWMCKTGQDAAARCQWANVVVPVAIGALGLRSGVAMARQLGFLGEVEVKSDEKMDEYARWLSRRHGQQVWGRHVSNAMAMMVAMVLYLDEQEEEQAVKDEQIKQAEL